MTQQDWVPYGIDTATPSAARSYDYLLGGGHNFPIDREMAEKAIQILPSIRDLARMNRAFLGRAVRFMAAEGIRQFLDIGSGIPTVGNVHEVAQRIDPECRVVYVDRDLVAVAHSEMILAGNERADIVRADFRDVTGIFTSPAAKRLLNLDEPVGLLMVGLLHWMPDEWGLPDLLSDYHARVPAGSLLAISHPTTDMLSEELAKAFDMFNQTKSPDKLKPRSIKEVAAMFGDFELVDPGLVVLPLWRPDGSGDMSEHAENNSQVHVGVARKPG